MPLTLTLDHNRHTILEPGYRAHVSAGEAWKTSETEVGTQSAEIIADPVTGTLFLRPLNIQDHWLNSADQVASIIRMADMVVADADISARTVFEEYSFGNTNNYYIYHAPVTFANPPAMLPPGPPLPGAPPNLTGAPAGDAIQDGLTSIGVEGEVPAVNYTAPNTTAGTINSGRVVAYTNDPQPANAPFYLRWFHPHPSTLDPAGRFTHCRYVFMVGQLALEIIGGRVGIWEDISNSGDRSLFRRIWSKVMFNTTQFSEVGSGSHSFFSTFTSPEGNAGDRSLLFIPYFRNRVLLMASQGNHSQVESVPVRLYPKPAPEANRTATGAEHYNWEITRADKLAVWCLSPSPGRFQVQKIRYADGPTVVFLPKTVIPYTPATPPTVAKFGDEERGTDLTGTITFPAAYATRFVGYSDCPPPETATGDQTRTYDVSVEFTGEATHRWTPFLYGIDFNSPVRLAAQTATPVSVLDTGVPTSNILKAFVSWGDKPGDGRCEVELLDKSAFTLTPYYERSSVPVQLLSGGAPVFTGYVETPEVEPWFPTTRPRHMMLPCTDLWKRMADTILRDQVSFFGAGHISVVLFLMQQAGINIVITPVGGGGFTVTGAEVPTINTAALNNQYNTPIGALNTTARTEEEAKLIRDYWRPKNNDTAGKMIQRIAEEFSGWDVGFRTDGTPFYLPKRWFSGLTLRFFHSAADRTAAGVGFENNPLVRNPVRFETIEPDANAVIVQGAENKAGSRLLSRPLIDWASWQNPAAVNYIGQLKWIVRDIGDTLSCEELNRVARVLFDAARRRRRQIIWESDYIPSLKMGQLVEVGSYGNYRLKKAKCDFVDDGWTEATYTGEAD